MSDGFSEWGFRPGAGSGQRRGFGGARSHMPGGLAVRDLSGGALPRAARPSEPRSRVARRNGCSAFVWCGARAGDPTTPHPQSGGIFQLHPKLFSGRCLMTLYDSIFSQHQ